MISTFRCSLIIQIAILILLITSCSSIDHPIDTKETNRTQNEINNCIEVSDFSFDGNPNAGQAVIGIYDVWVNPSSMESEMIPLRNLTSEDVLEVVDITNFLKLAPCTDCAKLMSVGHDSYGNVVLGIGIKHPFDAGDPSKPITGRNRADLHVFNVEGIVVSDGDSSPVNFNSFDQTVGNFSLINSDGFTSYLDTSMDYFYFTESTLHPYILHFDDYSEGNFKPSNPTGFESVTIPGPSGNLVMPMGSGFDVQDYIFKLDAGTAIRFIFAVGCSYAVSAESKSERFDPEYRVPQHNKKAASEVKIEVVSNELSAGDTSSTAKIHVKVLDINHGVEVGTALNQMRMDSSVSRISAEVPGISFSPVVMNSPTPLSGNGRNPLDPLVFEIEIVNSSGAGIGEYRGLVKVLDSYQTGLNQSPLLNGMDGIKRVGPTENPLSGLFMINEFATYQIFSIAVTESAPTCVITSIPDPPEITQGMEITLNGASSSGVYPITTYEWDLDYDNVNFDVDKTGSVINVMICTPGTRDVALKVTDSNLDFSICTLEITINPDASAITGWGTDINLGGSPQGVQMSNMGFRGIGLDGANIYVVYWDWSRTNGSAQIWCRKSENYGQTWGTHTQITNYPGTIAAVARYPSIWVDKNTGFVYVAYETNAPNLLASGPGTYDIVIKRSVDGGLTWSADILASGDSSGSYYEYFPCLTIDDSLSPARLYVSFSSWMNLTNFDIRVARTTTDNFGTWTNSVVDDPSTSRASLHNCIRVNPVDHAILAVWGDAKVYSGDGSVRFDRSTDFGLTWGTDVIIRLNPSIVEGAYHTVMAINPSTGIAGVLWRESDASEMKHYFTKALNMSGTSWGAPTLMDSYASGMARGGSLDVTSDGHWICLTDLFWQVYFRQSQDDGITWSGVINVSEGSSIYDPNIAFDECKNVHIFWSDARNLGTVGTTEIFYDHGT